MSIKKGNDYLRNSNKKQAIAEYKKLDNKHALYNQAQFNILLIENNLKDFTRISTVNEIIDEPLVSIIMPVFNVAPYLDASILSVLNQTYKNIEVIIVNDASTDNGLNIINMFANQDKRIKVIDLEFNTLGGAGIPSNIGVDAAKGKYIAYADSDDILTNDAIEKMVTLAEKTSSEIVIADFSNFNDETRKIDISYDKNNWKDLPLNTEFSPEKYPSIFRLSPVPWRKLYNRNFLNDNNIRFPEGDYFYEDNPLHWFVLSQAKKVTLLDHIVAYHRMAREGQTMGANNYKLAAQYCHVNTVKNFFLNHKTNLHKVYWKELLDFSYRSGWVIDKQDTEEIENIIKKRYVQVTNKIVQESKVSKEEILKIRSAYFKKLDDYDKVYKDKDLTVILPVYNCGDIIKPTLDSLLKLNLKLEVFLMDDGSTDNSKSICEEYVSKNENFHLFTQNNKGAGVARNALIPLATGKYTFFLDADDTIDPKHLEEAVLFSIKNDYDLTLFKYRIHFFEKNSYRDMWNADTDIFNKLLKSDTNKEKKILSSGLINYPWNRIIKTEMLHDENIFFGKTVVHNDVPYHWHSIIAAKNIGVFDKSICNHRKFDDREQITNINDNRPMMVLEAYRYTNNIINRYEDYENISNNWKEFIKHLLTWAKDRIPSELITKYEERRKIILKELECK